MLEMYYLVLVYLSLICNLLFKMFLVRIYSVINGIPTILCFMSVMWNICLKGLYKSLFCSIVRVGIRNDEFFHNLLDLYLVQWLVYMRFWKGKVLDVEFASHSKLEYY